MFKYKEHSVIRWVSLDKDLLRNNNKTGNDDGILKSVNI